MYKRISQTKSFQRIFVLPTSTHEQWWFVLHVLCLIYHINIQWQVYRQASQHDGQICQIHLPLSCPIWWFTISAPRGRYFFRFLVGVLTPLVDLSRSPGWGTVLFTAQRALCAENRYSMAGSAREQLAACSLTLTHIHTNTNGHMTILAGIRCLPQYNDYTLSVCPCVSSLQTDTDCSLPQQQ